MSHDHQQGLACSNLTNVSFPKVPSDRNESKCELSSDNKLTSEEVDHLCSVLERAKVCPTMATLSLASRLDCQQTKANRRKACFADSMQYHPPFIRNFTILLIEFE